MRIFSSNLSGRVLYKTDLRSPFHVVYGECYCKISSSRKHGQNKQCISSTLTAESFYMSPPDITNKFSTNLWELGGTTEKYVRSKYLLNKCLLTALPQTLHLCQMQDKHRLLFCKSGSLTTKYVGWNVFISIIEPQDTLPSNFFP